VAPGDPDCGSAPCVLIQNTPDARGEQVSWAPRWIRFTNCSFEGGFYESPKKAVEVRDATSVYFANCTSHPLMWASGESTWWTSPDVPAATASPNTLPTLSSASACSGAG